MTSVLESLNTGLLQAFARDEQVVLLGEDVLDPYGGAFKVTRGLSTAYPQRVFTTPVSEAGITGAAAGMALRGLRPVVEIMFGDFVTLIADQLVNQAAKFRWMYNDQVQVPLVVRTPMGGRRGYGPTHSQTLEKLFLGVPGLRVLSPTHFGDPGELLCRTILETADPVLFIENKLLYLLPAGNDASLAEFDVQVQDSTPEPLLMVYMDGNRNKEQIYAPTYTLRLHGAPDAVLTIAAYGYMAELGRQAVLKLAYKHEIFAELVVPTQLAPLQVKPILESLDRTSRLLTIEEGSLAAGWGAEVLASCLEARGANKFCARRLAGKDLPIPASPALEARVLPDVEQIVAYSLEVARGR
jgi:pyruvate/2-oxoglutarate/acetoin dehydrogenase E1 component